METVWDWVTVMAFAALAVLLLQRSSSEKPVDHLWQYLPPGIGLAVANQFGNNDQPWIAVAILVAVAVYVVKVLKVAIPPMR